MKKEAEAKYAEDLKAWKLQKITGIIHRQKNLQQEMDSLEKRIAEVEAMETIENDGSCMVSGSNSIVIGNGSSRW